MSQGMPKEVLDQIARNTLAWRGPEGLANARQNLPFIKRSVIDLATVAGAPIDKAIVVAAGPSLRRQDSILRIKALKKRPFLVACDGALAACLREDVVPDVVVSIDPHADRVVRWFGDRKLKERPPDDYFRRQDIDIDFREEERKNQEVLDLVDRYGPRLRAALSTSASQAVTERCVESKMDIFWWNPLYDDWSDPASYTRQVHELTGGIPCMTGLGHCGGSAWVIAHAVLGAAKVGIVGMDLGYPNGTSVFNTQYYEFVRHLPAEEAEQFLVRIDNPHTGSSYLTDPVYYWYRETFIDAVGRADCATVNCSGEGTVFGEGIGWSTVEEFAE